MAKNQKQNGKATISARDFMRMERGKGKPARPDNMIDAEWYKVNVNLRVPKLLKSLEAVARLTTIPGFAENMEVNARILSDIRARVTVIREAFENPKPGKSIKKSSIYC